MSSNGRGAPGTTGSDGHRGPLRRLLLPAPLRPPVNPALLKHSEQRDLALGRALLDRAREELLGGSDSTRRHRRSSGSRSQTNEM
jgi:hypothetical protein